MRIEADEQGEVAEQQDDPAEANVNVDSEESPSIDAAELIATTVESDKASCDEELREHRALSHARKFRSLSHHLHNLGLHERLVKPQILRLHNLNI